jgi:GTP-binding protein Era
MAEFKSGFVTLIGRTNVGKSTLINLLVGEKVAAIANKVQTTRTAIRGIVNRENSQIVFIDTPGIHKPKTKLNETMVETSFASIPDADVVLFLIEATSDEIGRGDRIILEKIKEAKRKTILIINKIDLVKREKLFNRYI